ncbi:TonB-dependent receptor [Dyella lipolytica]|uniref:TonB-dependent receptor n=1 Tax=Dyella lipolytica TaxID=1867835 RepID=A0ABW8IQX9_9GAMM|nr:TonB-dependent receptor [Dyella lipolytica]GLQ47074.1 TonB-dependent receptor [Dyella lipolytica]
MKRTHLSAAIAIACYMSMGVAMAQTASSDVTQTNQGNTNQRVNASSTSNTTTSNSTQRDVKQMAAVQVQAQSLSLGGGLMSVQTAPKAVSTITREAIEKASPGSNFTQLIGSIPGVNSATDDVTGLANGHYSMRGYDSSDIGMTVNGAPITDTGSYSVYATEYGDSENLGDITVLQGIPDIDMPDSGASGGHIGWATIDPSHQGGVDFTQSLGNNDYRRTFVRLNTGDLGPVRSWLSLSDNTANMWRGAGDLRVAKVDGKSVWTINDNNSVSASLQYSRQSNLEYDALSKAQVAQNGYFYNYNSTWIPLNNLSGSALKTAATNDENYYALHTNPYSSYMFSMDGEFKLADNLHLSVIPYYWYGNGGGSGGGLAQESTSPVDQYLYANADLNGDGSVTNSTKKNFSGGTVYSFSSAKTYRPGVIAKFNQDLGMDNSLEYGFWYERSRKTQADTYGLVDPLTGTVADIWGNSSYLVYPTSGLPQKFYQEYTNTELEKGFLTDNWTPNDYWTFTAGVSYLHANRNGFTYDYPGSTTGFDAQTSTTFNNNWNKFLPTAGIKFQLDERNQFFIGTGKTFRVPSNTVAMLDALVGVQNSNPEMSWNTDLGWRYYGDAISASADVYHSNYFNKQEAAFTEQGNEYYTTIPHMDMQGFNGEASYKFAPSWTVYTSYTYTQAKIKGGLDGGPGDANFAGGTGIYPTNGRTMPDTPRNIGNVSLSYDDSRLWATLNGRVTSSLYGDYMNTESVGGFTTFSFSAGYRFGDWDWLKKPYIKLNVDNLTDRHALSYVNSAQLLAKSGGALYPGLYSGSAPSYGLLQPRAYVITIGASFQ